MATLLSPVSIEMGWYPLMEEGGENAGHVQANTCPNSDWMVLTANIQWQH